MKKLKWCKWVSFVWPKMILLYFLALFLVLWHPCVNSQTMITMPTETSPTVESNDTFSYNNNNTTDFLNLSYETLEINSSKVMYNDEETFLQEESVSSSTIRTTFTTSTHLLDVYLNDDASVTVTKELLKKVINATSTSNSGTTIDLSLLSKNLTTWPTKHVANVEGDIILGGLMMVHEREDTIICGPIMAQGGIQALETMLFTLDYINGVGLLPNISIGAHILDDCDKGKCFCRLKFSGGDKKHLLYPLIVIFSSILRLCVKEENR